jgi:hypothetical protein
MKQLSLEQIGLEDAESFWITLFYSLMRNLPVLLMI